MAKILKSNDEARKALEAGVDKLADTVKGHPRPQRAAMWCSSANTVPPHHQ